MAQGPQGPPDPSFYDLRLYVAGQTPKSVAALANLKRFCEEHLAGKYKIEVVDLVENPKLARSDQILAIPTLVRRLPFLVEVLRLRRIQREDHFVSFGPQEVLGEVGCVRVTFGQEHQNATALLRSDVFLSLGDPFGEDAMSVRGARPGLHGTLDEGELADLRPGVEALAPLAALRVASG